MATIADIDIQQDPVYIEKRNKYEAKVNLQQEIFDQSGDANDFTLIKYYGTSDAAANLAKWKEGNEELARLNDDLKEYSETVSAGAKLKAMHIDVHKPVDGMEHPTGDPRQKDQDGPNPNQKSLGQLFVESDAFNKTLNGPMARLDISLNDIKMAQMKTVFRTGAGWDPQDERISRVVLDAQVPAPVIADVVPTFPTDQSAVVYMEETTFTNNAVEVVESTAITASDLFGEAALELTQRSSPVQKIAVFLPVSDEQMEDEGGIRAYVDQRLGFMIDQRLDLQIIAGDGSAPNLRGTLNVSNIGIQALGADSRPDAIYKGMDLVRTVGRANPNVVLAHPNDWQPIRLLTTADGIYIWGSPQDAGPQRIWGAPVILSTQVTENTVVTGDYAQFSGLFIKRGIEIQVSNSHSSYFTRGMQAIRADFRAALVHFRPAAFSEITGM